MIKKGLNVPEIILRLIEAIHFPCRAKGKITDKGCSFNTSPVLGN